MNLKTKLTHKVTSILQYNTETFAIFSDECSTNNRCMHILEGADKMEIYNKAKDLAVQLASTTKFPPVLMIISPTSQVNIKHLQPLQQEPYV